MTSRVLVNDKPTTHQNSVRDECVEPQNSQAVAKPQQRITIVMFSGGIDSTYTLVKLLRETDDVLLVHHINFVNIERRYEVEADRCRRIVDICRRIYRTFQYTESTLDHRAFQFFGFDMIAVGFEGGLVAHSNRVRTSRMPDRWTIGNCSEELTPEYVAAAGSSPSRWQHVLACLAANCFPHQPPTYFNEPVVTKREEIDYLPPEIRALTWTCRAPVFVSGEPAECGICLTCKLMTSIGVKRTVPGVLIFDDRQQVPT
jgi:hypothetical protein